jgi:hypothetical protein
LILIFSVIGMRYAGTEFHIQLRLLLFLVRVRLYSYDRPAFVRWSGNVVSDVIFSFFPPFLHHPCSCCCVIRPTTSPHSFESIQHTLLPPVFCSIFIQHPYLITPPRSTRHNLLHHLPKPPHLHYSAKIKAPHQRSQSSLQRPHFPLLRHRLHIIPFHDLKPRLYRRNFVIIFWQRLRHRVELGQGERWGWPQCGWRGGWRWRWVGEIE